MIRILPITPHDFQTIADWNADKDADYLCQWAGRKEYQYPLTAAQVADRCNAVNARIFMAFEQEKAIGSIELDDIDLIRGTARICRFILSDQARGRGLGRRVLWELIQIAFDEMGLNRLTLRVYCFNVGAIRCYQKCGFLVSEFHQDENPYWNAYTMELAKHTQQ